MSDTVVITEVAVDVEQVLDAPVSVDVLSETVEVEFTFDEVTLETGLIAPAPAVYSAMSHQVSATMAYQAEAAIGSGTDDAVWRIRRIEELAGGITRVLWAGASSAFVHVWDDRAGYTYS